MSRQDTVNKYIDQFLKGRGPESCERFRSKSLDKQYSSIMQWRRKLRREDSTPKSTREIIDALRRVNALVGNAPEMGEEDYNAIMAEVDTLLATVDDTVSRHREQKIRQLEEQSRLIAGELEKLRGGN